MSPAGRLVVLGAGGDLAGRFLFPALARLVAQDLVGEGFDVVGVAHGEGDDDGFRRQVAQRIERHAPDLDADAGRELCRRLRYVAGDAADHQVLRRVAEGATGDVVLYLALPPAAYEPVIESILDAELGSGVRVVVEKPFGEDLASARRLNRLLQDGFGEDRIFRIDHFLGMQTVQNLLGIRFGNRVFAALWSAQHVESIEVTWDEQVALEDRAGYYDAAGAMRDMVQNHLLQLLTLAAMEPPASLGADDLRDAKVEALRRVRRLSPEEVAAHTRRARYGAGRVEGRELPAYVDEAGVDAGRQTETFAEVTLFVDSDRWRGVPFRLRTGKALGRERHQIRVRFRPVGQDLFDWAAAPPVNELTLAVDPDSLQLDIALNGADDPTELEPAQLRADCAPQALPTYARLLLDIVDGNPTFAIRGDEAEQAWEIVEPILAAWAEDVVPLEEYPAGSAGPS